jgi:hypothetical protein
MASKNSIPESVVPSDSPVAPEDISRSVGYGPTNGVEKIVDRSGVQTFDAEKGEFVAGENPNAGDVPASSVDHTKLRVASGGVVFQGGKAAGLQDSASAVPAISQSGRDGIGSGVLVSSDHPSATDTPSNK